MLFSSRRRRVRGNEVKGNYNTQIEVFSKALDKIYKQIDLLANVLDKTHKPKKELTDISKSMLIHAKQLRTYGEWMEGLSKEYQTTEID